MIIKQKIFNFSPRFSNLIFFFSKNFLLNSVKNSALLNIPVRLISSVVSIRICLPCLLLFKRKKRKRSIYE
ncbi:hypothetical protein DERP_008710 [Dermatophagoides pteronyssinus]|uniref:Uncharacterized protein n=1 Tax=Dermatophagoides pteronyssinus TaxID=6956 RepID=A0ABQ8IW41_DERPT|nr:hypothetical protein DERP_008710 [Dermatophagoides pteronyssinus]